VCAAFAQTTQALRGSFCITCTYVEYVHDGTAHGMIQLVTQVALCTMLLLRTLWSYQVLYVATADRSSARKQWVKAMQTATANTTAAATGTTTASSTTTATSTAATAAGTSLNGRKGTLLPGASIGLAMVSTVSNLRMSLFSDYNYGARHMSCKDYIHHKRESIYVNNC
jgi:hypothetical protein